MDKEYEGGYTLKGKCLNKMGEYDLAIEYLLKAVEISPNNSKVNLKLGTTYILQKDDVIKGLPYLQKALELSDEDRVGICNSIGISYFHLSDYEKAEKYFLKTLELQIGCQGIFFYTHLLHNQGKFDKALQFEDSICGILDCKRTCNSQMAITYVYLKEFKLAEKLYKENRETGHLGDWSSITLAYIYKELGRNEEAMNLLNDTRIKLENQLSKYKTRTTYFLLSQIHAIQDEKNKAIKYLSEYEKIGFSSNWHDEIQIYSTFTNLWDDPEFKAIIKRAQEKKAAIRAQLKEMEERGEINL